MSMMRSFSAFDFKGFPVDACSVRSPASSMDEFDVYESDTFKGFTLHLFDTPSNAKSVLLQTSLSPFIKVDKSSGETYFQWTRGGSNIHDHHTNGYYDDPDKIVAYLEGSSLPYKKESFPFSECTTPMKDPRSKQIYYQGSKLYWVSEKKFNWIYLCYPYFMDNDKDSGCWFSLEDNGLVEHMDVNFFVKDV